MRPPFRFARVDANKALFQHRELVCALRRACKSGAIRFDEVMFPYVALSKDKAWQPGPYEGVELMILHKNESTGGVVVLRKFKQDTQSPRTRIRTRTSGLMSCPANGR